MLKSPSETALQKELPQVPRDNTLSNLHLPFHVVTVALRLKKVPLDTAINHGQVSTSFPIHFPPSFCI